VGMGIVFSQFPEGQHPRLEALIKQLAASSK
jgi:hypothetical protein